MGSVFSCVNDNEVPTLQRLQYDMTPIKSKSVPIIWLVGPPGSGRTTQCNLMKENLQFEHVKVGDLLVAEAGNDTDRGKIIKDGLNYRGKKIPDTIIIDLIKEEMLKKSQIAKGYVINNFPKNSKQAALFIKEIGNVDIIFSLHADAPVMVKRTQQKHEYRIDEETIRRTIHDYKKEVKEGMEKYSDQVEKVYTNDSPGDVYEKIEGVFNARLAIKSKAAVTEIE